MSKNAVNNEIETNDMNVFLRMYESHDDHGYKVLAMRLRAVKLASKMLLQFFRKKMKSEEDLSRNLTNMAAELKYESDTSKVNTTEQDCVDLLKAGLLKMAAVHMETSQRIKATIESEFSALRARHKKIIKEQFTVYERDSRHKATCKAQHQRMEKLFIKCCSDLSSLRDSSFSKSGKEAEKLQQRVVEADNAAKAAELKYKATEAALKSKLLECEENWRRSLGIFEAMERERISFLREKLRVFVLISNEAVAKHQETQDRLMVKVAEINIDEDLENFVRLTADLPLCAPQQDILEAFNVTKKLSIIDVTGAKPTGNVDESAWNGSASTNMNYSAGEGGNNSNFDENMVEIDYTDLSVEFPSLGCAMAQHEFVTSAPGELSFPAGQKMQILEKQGSGWWVAEIRASNGGPESIQRGLIPSNYVKIIT